MFMKLKAPEGATEFNHNRNRYAVDKTGHIVLPNEAAKIAIETHGYLDTGDSVKDAPNVLPPPLEQLTVPELVDLLLADAKAQMLATPQAELLAAYKAHQAAKEVPVVDEAVTADPATMTKKALVAELDKAEVKYGARASRDELAEAVVALRAEQAKAAEEAETDEEHVEA